RAPARAGRHGAGGGPHRLRAHGGSSPQPPARLPSPCAKAGAAGRAGRDRGLPGWTPPRRRLGAPTSVGGAAALAGGVRRRVREQALDLLDVATRLLERGDALVAGDVAR